MSLWRSNSSIGLSWSAEGDCRAVKLELRSDGYHVVGAWQAESAEETDLAASVVRALDSLGIDESTRIIAGGDDTSCAGLDIAAPRLTGQDLRNALLFELRRHSPLPVDQLSWGYRAIPGTARDNTQVVRLFYARDAEWTKWVENVSALGRRLDALLSPRLALDPAFSDLAVRLTERVVLGPLKEGRRELAGPGDDDTPVLGAGEKPLAVPRLRPGVLAEREPRDQSAFVPAIVLAAYALVGDPARDRKTLPPFPAELVPKRNRLTKTVAALLAVYVALVGALWIGLALKKSLGYRGELQRRIAKVEARIDELGQSRNSADIEKAIAEGLTQVTPNMPTMVDVLSELTDLIPQEYWVVKMSWTSGKAELEVRGSGTDLAFIESLEESPVLKEVELTDRKVDPNGDLILAKIRLLTEGEQVPVIPLGTGP